MDFRGQPLVGTNNLQAQINVINATLTTIAGQITTLQTNVTTLQGNVTTLQGQTAKLSDSGSGHFTSFVFSSGFTTDLTPSILPFYGNGLFIVNSHMTDGMSIHVTIFGALQVAATIPNSATLQLFLSSDTSGATPYTDVNSFGVLDCSTQSVIFEFWINIKSQASATFIAISKFPPPMGGVNGLVVITPNNTAPFGAFGGMPIFLLAKWSGGGTTNLGIYDVLIERTTLF